MTHASLLQPAFQDSVHATQQVFRKALAAMSEPGLEHEVTGAPALDRLAPATYALCLSLFDADTPIWVSPSLDSPMLRANLAFHCGCPFVDAPENAAFALVDESMEALTAFNPGTDRDPDVSCTVLIQAKALEGGPATTWTGPGISDSRVVHLPLPGTLWAQRSAHGFPKGLDFFITAGTRFVGLPRSTRVTHNMQEVV